MTKGQTARVRALQVKTSSPLNYGTVLEMTEMEGKCSAVSVWTWMFQSTHMEDARCFLVIPLSPL